jgi:retinol dehydrogenase 14
MLSEVAAMVETLSPYMNGKIVLITGANSGIGKETALELAKLSATVIMVSRDQAMGKQAQNEIIESSGNKEVHLMIADLASLKEVRTLAEEFTRRYDRLHVLINNAGGINFTRSETKEGFETSFGVNHLAHFLLTKLLLNLLKASAPSRIINVSSMAHSFGKMDFSDLMFKKKYSALKVYSASKLANILFTYELARRLKGTGVTANALHPGLAKTRFGKSGSSGLKVGLSLLTPIMISAKKGALTTIYLASSPEVETVSGKYFVKCKPKASNKLSYDKDIAKQLWDISERFVERHSAEKAQATE